MGIVVLSYIGSSLPNDQFNILPQRASIVWIISSLEIQATWEGIFRHSWVNSNPIFTNPLIGLGKWVRRVGLKQGWADTQARANWLNYCFHALSRFTNKTHCSSVSKVAPPLWGFFSILKKETLLAEWYHCVCVSVCLSVCLCVLVAQSYLTFSHPQGL